MGASVAATAQRNESPRASANSAPAPRTSAQHATAVDLDAVALGTFVERPRLLERLGRNASEVVLLEAPTGYGKTVLLAQWAAADPRPFEWITLTPDHDDPAALVAAVLEALGAGEPAGSNVAAALGVPEPDLDGTVLPRLERALGEEAVPMVLVLDELEHIESPRSLDVVRSVAGHLPSGSQLVLSTRSQPALPLGRMRANRRLTELRRGDLAMTRGECELLLAGAGLEVDADELDVLFRRTEGWPAALYLAALALSEEPDRHAAIRRFAGDDRYVVEYVRDEFLAPASKRRVEFLRRVSILDRLSGELCDAVLERKGSATTLRNLSRENVLLLPLDRRDEWFRFHALLGEMLRSELHRVEPEVEAELHRRASAWWSAHGDSGRAIHHAIEGGDADRAGELLWAGVPEYMASGRWATVKRWIDRVGPERLVADPFLSLTAAHGFLSRGEGAPARHWAEVTRSLLPDAPSRKTQPLVAGLALLDATLACGDVTDMRDHVAAAVDALPEDDQWMSMCRTLDGVALHLMGREDEARDALTEGARRAAVTGVPIIQCLALAQLALLAADVDDWQVARMLASQARAQTDRSGLGDYPTMAIVMATSAYVRARTGAAEEALADLRLAERLVARVDEFGSWFKAEVPIVLARAAMALGEARRAIELVIESERAGRPISDAPSLELWRDEVRETASGASFAAAGELTPAELRVLRFLPTHLTFPQIAAEVYVSPNTVKTQAQAVYRKLGVSSRREAVARAAEAGIIPLG
jgi:LuxR family transcriptional regulator, maltose regulon positive regulatory protein